MSREEPKRLEDIRDAIQAIDAHIEKAGTDPAALDDPLLHDALLFQFVVIGEAVKNLSDETRASAPEIPWDDVAGLHDMITHEYFRIDMDRVLAIVERDLPPLEQTIARLLGDDAHPEGRDEAPPENG